MACLDDAILRRLTSRGILAYVAVALAGNAEATTAALAGLVRCQTGIMLEGLKELTVEAPNAIRASRRGKWICGEVGASSIQLLDSSRYKLLVDDLKRFWDFLNPGIPFSLGRTDGVAIRSFLSDHPLWTQEHWLTALRHRAKSVVMYGNGSRTESFGRWIRKLGDYAAGPLNSYGKPVEGINGKATLVQQGNRAAVQQFLTAPHS